MPPLRRPPSPPVLTGAFLVTVLALPLANRALRPVPEPPESCDELAGQLRQCRPTLHVIPANSRGPENGVYICERPQSQDHLWGLHRCREYAEKWTGVVYCERIGAEREVPTRELVDWGEHGMRAGRLLFFGDPRLLADLAPLVGVEGAGR
jgi:hypothetical protein